MVTRAAVLPLLVLASGQGRTLAHEAEDGALKVLKTELDQDGFPGVSIQEEGVPIEV